MDLKPENIMLDRSGNIYLIDFGAALFAGEKIKWIWNQKLCIEKTGKDRRKEQTFILIYIV